MNQPFRPVVYLFLTLASVTRAAETPEEISLWSDGAPGSEARRAELEQIEGSNITNVHNPSLTPYLPDADLATGTAVIVCPGGGHKKLCVGHEGYALCEWFREQGIAAFLLKYRLSNEEGTPYTLEGHAMDDTRRAIRLVRSRAAEWGLQADRIGIVGFSAGGELAAYSAMWPEPGDSVAKDPVETVSSRPDFQGLIYPGKSSTFTVEAGMPPAFIACGYGDRPDIAEGMAALYLNYKAAGVKAELHIYSNAGHGFGYRPDRTDAAGIGSTDFGNGWWIASCLRSEARSSGAAACDTASADWRATSLTFTGRIGGTVARRKRRRSVLRVLGRSGLFELRVNS